MMPTKPKYVCGGRVFDNFNQAVEYANFIAKISNIILGIEEVV